MENIILAATLTATELQELEASLLAVTELVKASSGSPRWKKVKQVPGTNTVLIIDWRAAGKAFAPETVPDLKMPDGSLKAVPNGIIKTVKAVGDEAKLRITAGFFYAMPLPYAEPAADAKQSAKDVWKAHQALVTAGKAVPVFLEV